MLVTRPYLAVVLLLWAASLTWLVKTRIWPTLFTGSPPTYAESLPSAPESSREVCWSILYEGQSIGQAYNRITRHRDGTGFLSGIVQFEKLPVKRLMRDLLGPLGAIAAPRILEGDESELNLAIRTDLGFDNYGQLHRFETSVDVRGIRGFVTVEGRVIDDLLHIVARAPASDDPIELFRDQVQLPPAGLVADTFSPRPHLAQLKVGQSWIIQSYRPFLPHSPLELIEATVEREEVIEWRGQIVRTMRVAYRRDAGSGLTTAREPVSQMWVRRDGEVLRHDVQLATVRMQFIRFPEGSCQPPAETTSR